MVIADSRSDAVAETQLLTRARAGDAEAYCQLAQACETRLFRQAIALGHDPCTAEDLVAETLIAAWTSLVRYNSSCRFSTWLYAILLHRHHKLIRRERSRPLSLSQMPIADANAPERMLERLPASDPTPADRAAQNDAGAALRRLVDALPTKHRQVVLLRFFQDASLAEIAAVLRCSVGTVKSRLHHALDKLRHMEPAVNLSNTKRDT